MIMVLMVGKLTFDTWGAGPDILVSGVNIVTSIFLSLILCTPSMGGPYFLGVLSMLKGLIEGKPGRRTDGTVGNCELVGSCTPPYGEGKLLYPAYGDCALVGN